MTITPEHVTIIDCPTVQWVSRPCEICGEPIMSPTGRANTHINCGMRGDLFPSERDGDGLYVDYSRPSAGLIALRQEVSR